MFAENSHCPHEAGYDAYMCGCGESRTNFALRGIGTRFRHRMNDLYSVVAVNTGCIR